MDNKHMGTVIISETRIHIHIQEIQRELLQMYAGADGLRVERDTLKAVLLNILSGIYRDEEGGAHLGWNPERLAQWEKDVRGHLKLPIDGNPSEE